MHPAPGYVLVSLYTSSTLRQRRREMRSLYHRHSRHSFGVHISLPLSTFYVYLGTFSRFHVSILATKKSSEMDCSNFFFISVIFTNQTTKFRILLSLVICRFHSSCNKILKMSINKIAEGASGILIAFIFRISYFLFLIRSNRNIRNLVSSSFSSPPSRQKGKKQTRYLCFDRVRRKYTHRFV